jgi:3-methyladenine DNA glycosylase AlkD
MKSTSADRVNDALDDLAALPRKDTPSVRKLRRRYSHLLKPEPGRVVLEFARTLLTLNSWEARVIAWEVLASHPEAAAAINDRTIEQMSKGLSDWGSVDLFGVTILGQAWREGHCSDAKISAMIHSEDRWRRRLALVATVPLNSKARGGDGDARRTLWVCRELLDDRDDMVVKALSWALRELAKRNPTAVMEFVKQNNDRLASRVHREVLNKLETGLKSGRGKRAR